MVNFKNRVSQAAQYIAYAEQELAQAIQYAPQENVDVDLVLQLKREDKPRLHKRLERLKTILVALQRKGF